MSAEDEHREKAEALLKAAAATEDLAERGRLIDEALQWHNLALAAHDATARAGRANDNDDVGDDLDDGQGPGRASA
jgi:hypothetical protein